MDSRAKELIKQGDHLFEKRGSLLSLWQEIADNFYPERADFTLSRSPGDEFAAHLMTSYPVIARRDLGNSFSSMLRPNEKPWFANRASDERRETNEAKRWLEWATGVQKRAMYDRVTQFVRATKEGDHDFAAFGQAVLQAVLNRRTNALLYRTWHLRDVAWCENAEGQIDTIHRRWKPTLHQLLQTFPGKTHQKVGTDAKDHPYNEIECRHIIVPSERYEGAQKYRTPYVSIYIDVENQHVMEEIGVWTKGYVIPRWQTVSGSQYAYSPATICALPDARLIQAMTGTLLEAGEMAVRPPMLAVQEAIRSDIQLFAGGITWADADYDERLGEVLRPISQDKSGIPLGRDMAHDVRAMIVEAFYLNKMNLPVMGPEMTAFEVGQRVQEYIRQALPIFEPMESEYNGALCDETFEILFRGGAFGPMDSIPEPLRGADLQFRFESPLRSAQDREKGQKFLETKAMLAEAAALDPGSVTMVDARAALRDVLGGIGTPAKWLRDDDAMAAIEDAERQQQAAQQALAGLGAAGQVAEQAGKAGIALQQAGMV